MPLPGGGEQADGTTTPPEVQAIGRRGVVRWVLRVHGENY
jgi:hypothetical protein